MIDLLEELLAQVEEENPQGDALVLDPLEMPRWQSSGVMGQSGGQQPSWAEGGETPPYKMGNIWDSLLTELFQMERRAQGGQSLDLRYNSQQSEGEGVTSGGRGAVTLASQVARQASLAQTALEMTGSGGRHQVAGVTVQTSGGGTALRTMDRAMERDARRYDGGYLLG